MKQGTRKWERSHLTLQTCLLLLLNGKSREKVEENNGVEEVSLIQRGRWENAEKTARMRKAQGECHGVGGYRRQKGRHSEMGELKCVHHEGSQVDRSMGFVGAWS